MPMLETIFGSKTRARILELILLEGRKLRLLELQRAVGTSISSVQRELVRLESLGLARSEYVDGTRVISAVEAHPLAPTLRAVLAADRDASAP